MLTVSRDSESWTSGQAENIESLTDPEIQALGFPTRSQLDQMAQDSPGSYWYVFGEPNRYGFMTGVRFAPVFHYLATQIKQADPTAKIVGTSMLNWDFTCVGCGGYVRGEVWLADFINAHLSRYGERPQVDVWAIDVYPIDWDNTPNNDPNKLASYKGDNVLHSYIATQQIQGMREYLDTLSEYTDTPIWITEVAVHVGYDDLDIGPSISPIGGYHWDKMSDYMIQVLDWLEANAGNLNVERWFFFSTWDDIENPGNDGYMGTIFFDDPNQGASRNCLGDLYSARSLGGSRVKCDASGNTVPE